ncbi:MAG TPA: hypothetical protein VI300_08630 [Solirubrobacter sp.]
MRLPVLALLVVPVAAAALMLAVAGPAGDTVNDSVVILFGAPAATSALATFLLARGRDRTPGAAGGWALASAVAAALFFAALFVTLVIAACAIDTGSCS